MRLLLDNGGDVNSQNLRGGTPLIHVVSGTGEVEGTGRLDLLLDRGANIDHQDVDADTAQLNAVFFNKVVSVAALIRRGANLTLVNK